MRLINMAVFAVAATAATWFGLIVWNVLLSVWARDGSPGTSLFASFLLLIPLLGWCALGVLFSAGGMFTIPLLFTRPTWFVGAISGVVAILPFVLFMALYLSPLNGVYQSASSLFLSLGEYAVSISWAALCGTLCSPLMRSGTGTAPQAISRAA
jgi:hypothetical protein